MIDPADPEGSAARAYLNVLLNRDLPYKLSIMKRLCREYGATGAIFHSDRSCKPYSIGQIDLKGRLASEERDRYDPASRSMTGGIRYVASRVSDPPPRTTSSFPPQTSSARSRISRAMFQ